MVLNETALLATPVIGPIFKIFAVLQGLIGGLFGVYLVLVILRWKEYKQSVKILKSIRHELKMLNEKISFPKKKK
ncbi:hypothetical protein GOV06_02095 [Candidatus Woesearchaeota archaeon]|nr:hypothetical protein [Candidatus Woesearchaeota archaeon]